MTAAAQQTRAMWTVHGGARVSLLGNGGEAGRAATELPVPQTADDRLEPGLFTSDTERRQASLVGASQVVVRLVAYTGTPTNKQCRRSLTATTT